MVSLLRYMLYVRIWGLLTHKTQDCELNPFVLPLCEVQFGPELQPFWANRTSSLGS